MMTDGDREVWDQMQADALDQCAHCGQRSSDFDDCPRCGLSLSLPVPIVDRDPGDEHQP